MSVEVLNREQLHAQRNAQVNTVSSSRHARLAWTLHDLAGSLSVSVPFLRLELKRGRLRGAHLGRRVVVLDSEVQRYLADANDVVIHRRS